MTTSKYSLEQQLAELPKEMSPGRDLWPGIAGALAQPTAKRRSHAPVWLAAAACALVAIVSTSLWRGPANPALAPEAQLSALTAISRQHEQQKQALLVTLADSRAVTTNWHGQLTELEQAAEAIQQALRQDPDNPVLLRMLHDVYQQQFLLIERVHAPKWQQI